MLSCISVLSKGEVSSVGNVKSRIVGRSSIDAKVSSSVLVHTDKSNDEVMKMNLFMNGMPFDINWNTLMPGVSLAAFCWCVKICNTIHYYFLEILIFLIFLKIFFGNSKRSYGRTFVSFLFQICLKERCPCSL